MVGWEQERDWRRGSVQSADGGGSSTATAIANQFIARLRVKNDAARLEAAHELFSYVNGELKDNPNSFVEEFLYRFDVKAEQSIIHDMISSNDSGERKAGIFMIVCLIEAYINLGDMSKRVPRFSNYLLKKSLTSTDQSVMELAARAIAYVVITSKTYAAEVVEKSLNQACEWLEEAEPNESRRLAAVLLSRELARCTPTFFFQRATRFFDHVFKVIKDAKPNVREEAVGALRAALVVTSQRETKQQTKTHWYKHCYDEATHCFRHESASPNAPNLQRDDRWHSGLLIINELLRIANADGERMRLEAEELIIDRMRHRKRLATARKTLAPSVISQSGAEDVIDWLTMPTNAMNIESRTGRRLVEQEYANMCKMAMEAQKSRSPSVQHVLLELLPRLAAFDESTLFVEQYLDQSVEYVLGFLNKEREKGRAFLALGLLSLIAKNGIKRYVPRIVQVVRTGLPPPPPTAVKKKAAPPADQSVFICLTLIVRALKHEIEPQIKELLRPMFAGELSVGLTVALREMSKNIPSLRGDIQDGLLEQLSMLLMHKPMPSKLAPPLPPELPSGPVLVPDVNTTVLALETLGQFQFQRHSLQMFIKYIAYGYLNSEMTQVRLAAVQCCCYLLVPFLMLFNRTKDKSQKITLLVMIQEVIGKLLAVAVTDSSKNVRLRVFECLSEPKNPFLSHLAQSEMLELIFMGLHDEEYDIREAAVCLLGQLGEINPAYVMPILRRVVIQILSELNNSGIGRIEEKSARLLAQVACNSPQFMKPYMHMVLKTLIPKLRKDIRHVDATVSVLNAIGELAQVGGPELVEVLDKLVPILIHFLQDTSSLARREAALRTLGQVCQNTGFVVDPYRQYPDLLEVLLRFLKTEHSATMRRETIRVLGILGALDPYTHKVFMGTVQSAATSNTLAVSLPTARDNNDMRQDIIQWFNYERCTLEEFYPAIAIANLMHMIQDPSLVELQMDVVKAVMTIFSKLGSKCVQYVEQVVPRFLTVIRDCRKEGDLKQFFFLQLGTLASIVRQHIKPYLREIFELIGLSWTEDAKIRITIITLLEQVAIALGYEFKPYVPQLCPYMLRVLQHDKSKDKMVTAHVLRTLQAICSSLEEHLHLIIPPIVKIFDDKDATPLIVRQSAINTLYVFATEMSIAVYAPRILHAWLRAMGEEETRPMLVKLLYVLMQQMARKFLVFRPSVDAVLARHRVLDPADRRYEELLHAIEQNTPLNTGADDKKRGSSAASYPIPESSDRKQRCNFELLRKTWLVTQVGSKEDWTQWLVNLRVQLLKHSPYSALKACGSLAEIYEPLARDLFNAAFMSVWTELSEEMQNNLTDSLYEALKTSDHSEIIQTILNLAEFMDHSEKGPLPVQYDKLSECALQTRAYAKALRYKELQIHKAGGPAPADCEALITLTNKLNLQEEAAGVVEYAGRKKITISMQGRWYEKLHQWEKALDMYEMQQQQGNETRLDVAHHRMRCLEALGEWGRLNNIAKEYWEEADPNRRQKIAVIAAKGAWGTGDWSAMETYVAEMNRNNQDGAFLHAVLSIRKEDYKVAKFSIDKVRDMLDTELTAMAGESYERAYGAMVMVQQLSELEEAIQYKLMPDRRHRIAATWWRRLQGCREDVEDWQRMLLVHSLVLTPDEMRQSWTKFASLCRRHDKIGMARRVLCMLLDVPHSQNTDLARVQMPSDKPDLVFACCKHLFAENKLDDAFARMRLLADHLHRPQPSPQGPSQPLATIDAEHRHLTAKCFLKLGQWLESRPRPDLTDTAPDPQAMVFYHSATEYDGNWYKAWHSLAACHFNAVLYYKNQLANLAPAALVLSAPPAPTAPLMGPTPAVMAPTPPGPTPPLAPVPLMHSQSSPPNVMPNVMPTMDPSVVQLQVLPPVPPVVGPVPVLPPPLVHSHSLPAAAPIMTPKTQFETTMTSHALRAIQCFFRAINLARGSRLQDTLRLLTLWFEHGHNADVYSELKDGLQTVPVEMWLEVIPQLIARIDTPRHWVARLINEQLSEIGKFHPQALVYPLTVASKSHNKARSRSANHLLMQIAESHRTLVAQGKLVSDELIRVAILWHELWHEGLDEASRVYFQDKNVKGMFEILEPLHNMIEQGATTLKEQSFNQTYKTDLQDARKFCRSFQRTQNAKDLTQAWELYYTVFKRITQQLRQLTTLDLNYVSPKLLMANNMELAVPGTYDPKKELISIASIHTNLQVITSKQRPRKVCIRGSDGQDYVFLLKGHEDPRQDERVMQLFGLVNTLLLQESDTCRRNLTIQRYSIVPLSQNSGLIGWVPNCDTLHGLIRDYRDKKKIMLSIEHKLMQTMAPDLDQLMLMQKLEVFEHALEMTKGDDLQQILWLKSPSSEVWFDRRTNYTRSLACMSMVGYILGLGDRHPSNLMLDRLNGKIVHIDFGDCFEVAMTREKFPEKIPFRLTRMLINAMEVTGIEGNFRITSERVMRVLRENRESLLAVLEAFVYDPLINWRLVDLGGGGRRTHPPEVGSQASSDGLGGLPMDSRDSSAFLGKARKEERYDVGDYPQTEIISKKAIAVIDRIRSKLNGRDFQSYNPTSNQLIDCSVSDQVRKLIEQATSHENLCQCYIGWCPFW